MAKLFLAALLVVSDLAAAAIDGTWGITRNTNKGQVKFELKLKAEGSNLNGTYGRQGRRRTQKIQDGKNGPAGFSFTTAQNTKKGQFKMMWQGKVAGDEIQGQAGREGRRMQPFTAKRM